MNLSLKDEKVRAALDGGKIKSGVRTGTLARNTSGAVEVRWPDGRTELLTVELASACAIDVPPERMAALAGAARGRDPVQIVMGCPEWARAIVARHLGVPRLAGNAAIRPSAPPAQSQSARREQLRAIGKRVADERWGRGAASAGVATPPSGTEARRAQLREIGKLASGR